MLTVKEVKTAGEIKKFIEFPLKMYKNCPYFVPPFYRDEKKLLKGNTSTDDSESIFFLAIKDGKVVGRIQGIIAKQYNDRHNVSQARFNRFDCIDDTEVAKALFDGVEKWAEQKQMKEVCGPLGFSDLDREGLLIEGFNENSTFEEQYNYDYYGKLLESAGYVKDVDWVEYELRLPEKRNDMLERVAQRALKMNKLHIADTNISKRKYINKYRDSFFECLDICYRNLYGTVKLSKKEQDDIIAQFMMVINKEYALFICDENDNVVGFGLCFPNIGNALKKSGGRLTLGTLGRIVRIVRKPDVIDLGLVAILPEYRKMGINAVVLNGMMELLSKGNVQKCETNLNLETNTNVQSQWKHFDSRQHKRRRSYIKKIAE